MARESRIQAEKLFCFIGATYNELTEILIKVVSKHAVEDGRAVSTHDPNVALSEILSTDLPVLRQIKATSTNSNWILLFTGNNRKNVLPSIEISKLDCSLLLDLLLRFPGLMKTKDNANYMCNHKTNSCCGNCDHSSSSCKQTNCITKCKHVCKNCGRLESDCQKYLKVCKSNCSSCLQCNMKQFQQMMQNPCHISTPICSSFMYYHCWEIMLELRNCYGHYNTEKYQEFLDGKLEIKLSEFSFKVEKDFKDFLHALFRLICKHITDPAQRSIPFETEECEIFNQNIDSIFKHGKSMLSYVYDNMAQILRRSEVLHHSTKCQLKDILEGIRSLNSDQTEQILGQLDTHHNDMVKAMSGEHLYLHKL